MESLAPPPIWLLVLLALGSTMSMHMFVPTLPFIGEDLAASPQETQWALTAYIIGLAAGQIFYGPLSDRYGRRPALIFGMALFTIASIVGAVAWRIDMLIISRLFQALGASAGMTLSRAIVQDCSRGTQAARLLALLSLLVMAGPAVSPLLGALLLSLSGWRAVLLLSALLGLTSLLFVMFVLRETSSAIGDTSDHRVIDRYFLLLRSRAFLGFALIGGCASTSIYAFIAAAPYVFVDQLHSTSVEVGFYLGFNIIGMGFGSFTAGRLVGRMPAIRLLMVGNIFNCAGAGLLLWLAASGTMAVASTLGALFILTCGAGMVAPMAMACALAAHPGSAGSASGLYGCSQMLVGAVCTALAGLGTDHAVSAAITMLGAGLLALLTFHLLLERADILDG